MPAINTGLASTIKLCATKLLCSQVNSLLNQAAAQSSLPIVDGLSSRAREPDDNRGDCFGRQVKRCNPGPGQGDAVLQSRTVERLRGLVDVNFGRL